MPSREWYADQSRSISEFTDEALADLLDDDISTSVAAAENEYAYNEKHREAFARELLILSEAARRLRALGIKDEG